MMKNKTSIILLVMLCLFMPSCEKISSEDSPSAQGEDGVNVTFRVSMYTLSPLGVSARRVRAEVGEVCSRISYAVFDGDNKLKAVNQVVGDDGFGTLLLTLPLGTYRFVVIAHNGLGNATITSPDKIAFSSNKCTDTFCYYQEVSITEDVAIDVTLKRVVALVRFIVEDPIPSDVAQMKFYYIGGSSTLDAMSGYGCVNSKQTEYRDVDDEMRQGGGTFDLFTFPHTEKDTLKLTVTAMTSDNQIVQERTFTTVPVVKNSVTQYSGKFFGSSDDEGDLDVHFEVDTTWVQLSKYFY